ncbi:MAG: two-component system sensor histidine kinase CreC [Ideonella sp. MAG2]|nr:MAG: two-component system sensor histidine kinase CreC [Ideonella sp. MAG2]
MRIGLRLLGGFLLITGLAAFFVLRVFLAEVKPSVREVMEDILIDTANLLAETATPDLAALTPGGTLEGTAFAQQVQSYANRPIDAKIWGLNKRTLDFRVYVTDAAGRVVFDSGPKPAVGEDYSRWRDVARTLRGEYGARATREVQTDDRSSVMFVAAPVQQNGRLLGVVTVGKPLATVAPFIDRAERKIFWAGVWLMGLSLLVGLGVTFWTVASVRRLRSYALAVGEPEQGLAAAPRPPELPGELGELAQAMDRMRQRLEGRDRLEHDVRALTHELKSPLTAIQGAAELLQDDLPAADRQRFTAQIEGQVQRLRELVDKLLALSKLETQRGLAQRNPLDLVALTDHLLEQHAAMLSQTGLTVRWLARDHAPLRGDAEALTLALSNALVNASQHGAQGQPRQLDLAVLREGREVCWSVRDHGPGVPDYALPQLGQRFFATANPLDGRKGSGLGLAIVGQVVALHGGRWSAQNAQPGLRLSIRLPT